MNSRRKRWAAAVAVLAGLVVVAIVGCTPDAQVAYKATVPQGPTASMSLRVTDAEGFRETLGGHRGRVVLVDFWATWCAPCVEQFPHTVTLQRKYGDRGLAVIGVSLNDPDAEPMVREFLERHDARFDNLLSNYRSPVDAIKAYGLPGPIPCYRLYDRSGELRREFTVDPRAERQFTSEDIEATIAELL